MDYQPVCNDIIMLIAEKYAPFNVFKNLLQTSKYFCAKIKETNKYLEYIDFLELSRIQHIFNHGSTNILMVLDNIYYKSHKSLNVREPDIYLDIPICISNNDGFVEMYICSNGCLNKINFNCKMTDLGFTVLRKYVLIRSENIYQVYTNTINPVLCGQFENNNDYFIECSAGILFVDSLLQVMIFDINREKLINIIKVDVLYGVLDNLMWCRINTDYLLIDIDKIEVIKTFTVLDLYDYFKNESAINTYIFTIYFIDYRTVCLMSNSTTENYRQIGIFDIYDEILDLFTSSSTEFMLTETINHLFVYNHDLSSLYVISKINKSITVIDDVIYESIKNLIFMTDNYRTICVYNNSMKNIQIYDCKNKISN